MDFGGIIEQGQGGLVGVFFGGLGLSATAMLSKGGGGFVAATNPVLEIGLGFYSLRLTGDETNVTGPLLLNFGGGPSVQMLVWIGSTVSQVSTSVQRARSAGLATDAALGAAKDEIIKTIRNVIGPLLFDLKQGKIRHGG